MKNQTPDFSQPVSKRKFYCLSNVYYVKDKRNYYKIRMWELYGSVWTTYEIVVSTNQTQSDFYLISCICEGSYQTRKPLSILSFFNLMSEFIDLHKDWDLYCRETSMDTPPVPPTITDSKGEIVCYCLDVDDNVLDWVYGYEPNERIMTQEEQDFFVDL